MDHTLDADLALKDSAMVGDEKFLISTIKMEVRHSWLNQHENVFVYETMVFEDIQGKIQYQKPVFYKRYADCEEAKVGHEETLKNIEKIIRTTRECRARLS